jgi:lipoprotein-anchoring transpeptidase ErfK/SrfK
LAVVLLAAIVLCAVWLWRDQKDHRRAAEPATARAVPSIPKREPTPVIPSLVLVERNPSSGEIVPLPTNTPAAEAPPTAVPRTEITSPAPPAIQTSNPPPPIVPPHSEFPRPVRDVLEAQIALARRAISAGSIDGAMGSQTRAALAAFQREAELPLTRALDTNTEAQLTLDGPLLTDYVVTSNDLARLQPLGKTWIAKSEQSALDYETILELVAEKAHAYPSLVMKFNPGVDWTKVRAGDSLRIPDVVYPEPAGKAARVVIHLSDKMLEAFDTDSNLLAHFPCSIAARVEKRPVGELHVAVVAPNPNYTFDPAIFTDSPEAQAIGHKLVLPPGPNNPVGVAWIGLDKPGYGMHGTPSPEQIGRTESHGCFRLANWDAEYLLRLVWIGMPVDVLP